MWRLFRNIRCSQSRPKTLPLLEFTLWSLLPKDVSVHIIHIICHMMHILPPMFFVQILNLRKYWICANTEFVHTVRDAVEKKMGAVKVMLWALIRLTQVIISNEYLSNFMARNHIYTRESIVEGPTNGNPFLSNLPL